MLTSLQGLGSVGSGLTAGTLMRRLPERTLPAAGLALLAIGVLARATPWTPVVLGGSLALGLGLPVPLIAALTAVQRHTPSELLGRVTATAGTVMYAPTGLALLLGAGMVARLDYRVQLLAAGTFGLAAAATLTLTGRTTRAARTRAPDGARPLPETKKAGTT
ncbi:MFS transporter [Streptomyces sp. NPDC127038]|uniref:MFS transporter n=1 Tax=Streptomyces sp. NPDC127038 TaxID=3347114 RepID=UPI00364B7833